MNPASETLLVAPEFARTSERLGIAHLLGESLASATYGEARTTIDADFAVHMTPEQAVRFAEALQADYHVQSDALVEAAVLKRMSNVSASFLSSRSTCTFGLQPDTVSKKRGVRSR